MKNLLYFVPLFLVSFLSFISFGSGQDFPKPTAEMLEQVSRLKAKGFTLIDYHIHLRGGMTAEKAFDWEKKTGVVSGVLENHGRAWTLSDNEKLAAFIKDARRFPVLVGIQVNDRDWYKTIT
ncbi:MAG: hypothetical protein FWE67_06540, partial [Planctomycetaceae bacterium]|nr:hypothetical protein [Planctomycetaceae bacterium]